MRHSSALCIASGLIALASCAAPRSSDPRVRYETINIPGTPIPAVEIAVHPDGTVKFPEWMEKQGKTIVKVGNANVEALAKMSVETLLRHYQSQNDLRASITFQDSTLTKGRNVKYAFLFQRPNRFAFLPEQEADEAPIEMPIIVCDGARVLTYLAIPGAPQHTFTEAPPSLEGLQQRLEARMSPAMGVDMLILLPLLAKSMTSDEYLSQFESVRHLDYLRLDRGLTRRLQFVSPGGESATELWLDGKKHWLKRAYINTDLTGALDPDAAAPQPLPAPGRHLTVLTFDWSNDPLPETAFAFQPPADSVEKETLFEDVLAAAKNHESVGTAAPQFELRQLDNDTESLQSLLKKHTVVIFDFWATWCVPCAMSLPIVDQITAKYAAQGVGFYAVNYREDEARVRSYMERRGFTFPVLLDGDGVIGKAFAVKGLPHTVVIDGKGVIRHVHLGADPKLADRLTGEIDELLH